MSRRLTYIIKKKQIIVLSVMSVVFVCGNCFSFLFENPLRPEFSGNPADTLTLREFMGTYIPHLESPDTVAKGDEDKKLFNKRFVFGVGPSIVCGKKRIAVFLRDNYTFDIYEYGNIDDSLFIPAIISSMIRIMFQENGDDVMIPCYYTKT